MQLIQVARDLSDYLASSEIVDFNDAAVGAAARGLSANAPNDVAVARAIFEFVRDDMPHTFDVGADEVAGKASEVLKYGHGTCYAKSHLLAAMMRYSGVPTGFCYQKLINEDTPSGYVLHGLNAAYFQSLNRWIRMDARGNKPGINVPFDIGSDMLAYNIDRSRGEDEDPRIFSEPAESVIKILRGSASAVTIARILPDSL